MEQTTTRSGLCPKCRKPLSIPAELEEFSCLYCGARLTPDQLRQKAAPVSQADAEPAYVRLEQELPEAVTAYPGVIRHLTRKAYGPYFSAYLEKYRPLFELLPAAAGLRADALETLATSLLDQLASWAGSKGSAKLDEAKFTLCLLTIPAIRSTETDAAEDFCRELHAQWMKRYPKRVFQPVTYAEIDKGFERKKLCYITTAVCSQLGKEDDCRELNAFRSFRDGWLSRQADGQELIRQYYDYAPGIVTAIRYAGDPDSVYPAIWNDHLAPCLEALDSGRNEECRDRYVRMVHALARTYLDLELPQ